MTEIASYSFDAPDTSRWLAARFRTRFQSTAFLRHRQRGLQGLQVVPHAHLGHSQGLFQGLDEKSIHLGKATPLCNKSIDHLLVLILRSLCIFETKMCQTRGDVHRQVEATAAVIHDPLRGANHQTMETSRFQTQVFGLQQFEETPGPGERHRLVVEDHGCPLTLLATHGQVEGRLFPCLSDLLLNFPLVVAKAANPITLM